MSLMMSRIRFIQEICSGEIDRGVAMKTVDIIFSYYYDSKGKELCVGGIQTYITNLIGIITEMGYNVRVFQYADADFHKKMNEHSEVFGIKTDIRNKKKDEILWKRAKSSRGKGKYITIIATDTMIPKVHIENSIAIQHGICWDIPYNSKRTFLRHFIGKSVDVYKILKRLSYVDNIVCVDYNFLNWYRATVCAGRIKCKVIPNFTKIIPKRDEVHDNISIIFARRFYNYRGTRIFANAIERIVKEHDDVSVTVAGDGEDKEWLLNKLGDYKNITFSKYSSEESLEIHRKHDIAVVPTLGSEGTSLSLLEAMSAGCAVICSNVGGMTNIILDDHNGLMIEPNEEELYQALKKLIIDKETREKISKNAYITVTDSFSYEKWAQKWRKIIYEVS